MKGDRGRVLDDIYIDDKGTVWNRPTAWAYYAACRALREHTDIAEQLAEELQGCFEREGYGFDDPKIQQLLQSYNALTSGGEDAK